MLIISATDIAEEYSGLYLVNIQMANINSAAPKMYKNAFFVNILKMNSGVYLRKLLGLTYISIEAYVNTNAKPILKNHAANLMLLIAPYALEY